MIIMLRRCWVSRANYRWTTNHWTMLVWNFTHCDIHVQLAHTYMYDRLDFLKLLCFGWVWHSGC